MLARHIRRYTPHYIFMAIAVFATIAISAYFILSAKAEGGAGEVLFMVNDTAFTQTYQPGQQFAVRIDLHSGGNVDTSRQVVLLVSYDSTKVRYVKSVCMPIVQCSPSGWQGQPPYTYNNNRPICMDIKPGAYEGNHVVSAYFNAVSTVTTSPVSLKWGRASGSCSANPNAFGLQISSKYHGACDPDGVASSYCEGPLDIGAHVVENLGQAPSQNSNNAAPSPTGRGGSGGGSTANTQSNQPNSIPAPTTQGEQKQPEIEPSPFFDGREYAPGSSAGASLGAIKDGRVTSLGWVYIAALLAAVGAAAGAFYWYRLHKK